MIKHVEKTRPAGWLGVARVAGRLGLSLSIFLGGYLLIYRPRQLRWGASDEEHTRAMPGDEIQPHPVFDTTRAITIQARPEQIWPWLMQIGYGRAGWYGYDWFDNDRMKSVDRIIPAWQHLSVGDTISIMKGVDYQVVAVEPNHFLVWASPDGGWSMAVALYPVDASHTRLVWRQHAAYNWTAPYIVSQLFSDGADLIAIRQNMLGIKERAEGSGPPTPTLVYTELALWVAAFLAFLLAEAGLVVRRDWLRPGLAVSTTGLLTIDLILLKPPVWVDGLVTLGAWVGLWKTYRPNGHRGRREERKREP
jgi:hypothetical protein